MILTMLVIYVILFVLSIAPIATELRKGEIEIYKEYLITSGYSCFLAMLALTVIGYSLLRLS